MPPNPTPLLSPARIVPTIAIDNAADAVPLAECLQSAGITLLEITLRTPAGLPAIRLLKQRHDLRVRIAAGTLRTADELHAAVDAGADLLISPGHTDALIAAAERIHRPWLPGCTTPSEVLKLMQHGHRTLKLFPALPGLFEALIGPFADLQFVPTGGVNAGNAAHWLAQPNVVAIAGSWLAPRALIAAHDWAEIHRRAVHALRLDVAPRTAD